MPLLSAYLDSLCTLSSGHLLILLNLDVLLLQQLQLMLAHFPLVVRLISCLHSIKRSVLLSKVCEINRLSCHHNFGFCGMQSKIVLHYPRRKFQLNIALEFKLGCDFPTVVNGSCKKYGHIKDLSKTIVSMKVISGQNVD